MAMIDDQIKWAVISQILLFLALAYFEAQANSIYALFLFSWQYFSCIAVALFFLGYYTIYFIKNIMLRETGSRTDQMNIKYMKRKKL